MPELITQTKVEDAVAHAETFLGVERGLHIDGDFAGQQIADRIATVKDRAEEMLYSIPHPQLKGLYIPLSAYNAAYFDEAAAVLPGYMVLIPSVLVDKGTSVFYPAVVSEDGLKSDALRLHVLRQPYRQQIGYGMSVVLSAAGQSETSGIGDHGRKSNDGIEAEHFNTLLVAGIDADIATAWQSQIHSNHVWRNQANNSVTTEVSRRLFGADIPQSTVTITREQIASGNAMLLWHEGMRDGVSGQPETAAQDNALVVIQALGYEALREHSPGSLDTVKRLLS